MKNIYLVLSIVSLNLFFINLSHAVLGQKKYSGCSTLKNIQFCPGLNLGKEGAKMKKSQLQAFLKANGYTPCGTATYCKEGFSAPATAIEK